MTRVIVNAPKNVPACLLHKDLMTRTVKETIEELIKNKKRLELHPHVLVNDLLSLRCRRTIKEMMATTGLMVNLIKRHHGHTLGLD